MDYDFVSWFFNGYPWSMLTVLIILNDFLNIIGTLNYSCTKAPAAVQEKETKSNETIFDRKNYYVTESRDLSIDIFFVCIFSFNFLILVLSIACYWSHCGSGSCNKTSKFSYDCICPADYYNLLNVSSFPCFKACKNIFLW